MAWIDPWLYRKSFTISSSSGVASNYQMSILVGESSGSTGASVNCNSPCKSDFSDLRFTAADGSTLLDYWISSVSGTTPNQLATVIVEFTTIGTTATTFYMYYGNVSASAYSNIKTTYLAGDDFTDGTIDTGIWTLTNPDAYFSEAGGKLLLANPHTKVTSLFSSKLVSNAEITDGIAVLEADLTWTTDSEQEAQGGLYIYVDENNWLFCGARATGGTYRIIIKSGGTSVYDITGTTKGKRVRISYGLSSGYISFWYTSGSYWVQMGATQTYHIGTTCRAVVSATDSTTFTAANPLIIDNMCFYKQLSVAPAFGTWGSQSAKPVTIVIPALTILPSLFNPDFGVTVYTEVVPKADCTLQLFTPTGYRHFIMLETVHSFSYEETTKRFTMTEV